MTQKQYADHRNALAAECKAMLAEGKSRTDIDAYLADVGTNPDK